MNLYRQRIRVLVRRELDAAHAAEALGHFATAFGHLERAHVLGQSITREHVLVHWRMFGYALRQRLAGESFSQAWRIVAAAIFTPVGLVPRGNTGGGNVSGVRPMEIAADLRQAMADARR